MLCVIVYRLVVYKYDYWWKWSPPPFSQSSSKSRLVDGMVWVGREWIICHGVLEVEVVVFVRE